VGDPQTAICDAVQRLNISLLVLGERGIGKIKRLILSYLQKGLQIYICFDAL
jgi:nucleotide-binding universal stress UspA family protein